MTATTSPESRTQPDPFTAAAPGQRLAAYRALSVGPGVQRVTLPDGNRAWLVTGHAEVRALLGDPRLSKALSPTSATVDRLLPDLAPALTQHMLSADGAEHSRLRRLVSTAFTPRRVEQLAPRIDQIAEELLDTLAGEIPPGEPVDLLARYAFPLPMTVICELVGVPEPDQDRFRRWTNVMTAASFADPEPFRAAATGLIAYIRELIELRRAEPRDDLLSALVSARDGSDRMSEDELTSMVWVLVLAGHETTVNLLSNGLYELLIHPEQLVRLRTEPELIGRCVEELLRVGSPVHAAIAMVATEPIEINQIPVAAGDIVIPALMAANHDPCRVDAPDLLDIGRVDNPHMAFGHGMHYCLGAPLARLEARIALASLLRRFPLLALAVEPDAVRWRPSLALHGPTNLPIILQPTR
ncbi:MAG TPA: cytochrome P450 [Pseudonocardia sp.]|jgi:cytochrome P450